MAEIRISWCILILLWVSFRNFLGSRKTYKMAFGNFVHSMSRNRQSRDVHEEFALCLINASNIFSIAQHTGKRGRWYSVHWNVELVTLSNLVRFRAAKINVKFTRYQFYTDWRYFQSNWQQAGEHSQPATSCLSMSKWARHERTEKNHRSFIS